MAAATAVLALLVGWALSRGVLKADQGTPAMKEIAKAIQEGAMAYLSRQFKTIAVILIPLALIVFFTSTAVLHPDGSEALTFVQSGGFRTLAFIGGVHVRIDRIHRHVARTVRGNVRTAAAARLARCRLPSKSHSGPAAWPACSPLASVCSGPRSSS